MALSRSGRLYIRLRTLRNRFNIRRKRLRSVHGTAYVHGTARVARDLVAEPYVFVGRQCDIPPLVTIGRYAMLASEVAIVGDDHIWDQVGVPLQFTGRPAQRVTVIGPDAWLGRRVLVMRGVHVGEGSVIAAGAVVTKDVPPYEVWGGVPAHKIKDRFPDDRDRERHAAAIRGPLHRPRFVEPLTRLNAEPLDV